VPEGATPKDGPSAGAAIATAIVSALTGIPVRRDIAMTGEISLRGMVLPIGGLKEKLLAALRSGIKKVLIPEKNLKDLQDIPENVKSALEIVPVSVISDVIKHALVEVPKVINPEDDKEEEVAKGVAISEEDKDGKVVRH
jgi:ATP-dependent Lon protease